MSYLVLARKYRPQNFAEVFAQDHITRILKNTIEMNRIAHAYLFTGPRGVGKTSLARILAKSLNCLQNGPSVNPCNTCQNCLEITQSISADVIEIDGASNTGVEDIRDLQKELMYSTSNSLYKIYIIDEVHMLSKNAFNALLKTLEEPPDNVIFIFATTEPHKVLPTIISRCQRYDFKRIPIPDIVEHLQSICQMEKISIEDDALFTVAKKADGSMRDSLSLLDQILALGKQEISRQDVYEIFGIVHLDLYREIMQAIQDRDTRTMIRRLHDTIEKGNDILELLNGFLEYVRNILMMKLEVEIHDVSAEIIKVLQNFSLNFTETELLHVMSILIKARTDIKFSSNPLLVAEMVFVKLTRLSEITSLESILAKSEPVPSTRKRASEHPSPAKTTNQQEELDLVRETADNAHKTGNEIKQEKPVIDKLTPEIYQQYSVQIQDRFRKEKPLILKYFQDVKVESINNNFIHYQVDKPIAATMLKENRDYIAKVLSGFLGVNINLDFKLEKQATAEPIRHPSLDDIKREAPNVAEFIEITDSIIT